LTAGCCSYVTQPPRRWAAAIALTLETAGVITVELDVRDRHDSAWAPPTRHVSLLDSRCAATSRRCGTSSCMISSVWHWFAFTSALLSIGAANVRVALACEAIWKVLRVAKPQLIACAEKHRARQPDGGYAKMRLQFEIAEDGRVSKAQILAADGGAFGRCLVNQIRRWRFPRLSDVEASAPCLIYEQAFWLDSR
jgi:hypothetical protein